MNYFERIVILTSENCISHLREFFFWLERIVFPIPYSLGIRRNQFLAWVEALSEQSSLYWLGLPNNSKRVLLASAAHDLVINLLKMQQLHEDEELAYSDGEAKGELV